MSVMTADEARKRSELHYERIVKATVAEVSRAIDNASLRGVTETYVEVPSVTAAEIRNFFSKPAYSYRVTYQTGGEEDKTRLHFNWGKTT